MLFIPLFMRIYKPYRGQKKEARIYQFPIIKFNSNEIIDFSFESINGTPYKSLISENEFNGLKDKVIQLIGKEVSLDEGIIFDYTINNIGMRFKATEFCPV